MTQAFPVLDWYFNDTMPGSREHLGRIPLLFDPTCADPAWLQLQTNYPEWKPEPAGWTLYADHRLGYPGQRPLAPAAMAWLRNEAILVYPGNWLCIVQDDGKFTVGKVML